MGESLKSKTVKGLVWSGIERLFGQVVTFVLALVLARLVTPADYGLLAIVMVFVTVTGLMVDAGFANALIRKVDSSDVDRSTVLYFNIAVSVGLYLILYFCSPFISSFYDNLELVPLIRIASVVVIVNSLSIVQQAILTSRVDFKKQTVISLVSSIVSGVVGVFLAYLGYGVWALVAQTIALAVIRTVMLWWVVRWRPLLVFSKDSFNDLFGYGSKLMISNLIIRGGKETIQLLLGKFYGTAGLGQYNYANKLGGFLPSTISTSIQRVLFPVFSQIQDDDQKLAENFRKSLVLTMTMIFPLMFGISSLAEPIIETLLTEEWLPTIPLLRVVAITMAVWPLLYFNINIFWVKKRSDLSLKLEIINLIFRLSIVLALFKIDILWVSIGLCIAEFLNFFVYAIFTGRINSYGLIGQLKDMSYLFFSAAVSALVVFYLVLPNIDNNILSVIIGFISIFVLYALLLFIRGGLEVRLLKEMINKRKKR